MTKSLLDSMKPSDCCTDDQAAGALAQGHPKSKRAPTTFGMRNRTQDGDGPDDDARSASFGKG